MMKIEFVSKGGGMWSVIYKDNHASLEYAFPTFEKATQFTLEMSKQFGLPY